VWIGYFTIRIIDAENPVTSTDTTKGSWHQRNRKIDRILKSKPTLEGAGVHLKRAFGYNEVPELDPFLLLDDFHSDNPADYIAGFPWHPTEALKQ
jgi:hypothetical protein